MEIYFISGVGYKDMNLCQGSVGRYLLVGGVLGGFWEGVSSMGRSFFRMVYQ